MVLDNDLVNSSVFSEYQCNFHPVSQDFCLAGSLMSISVLLNVQKMCGIKLFSILLLLLAYGAFMVQKIVSI